MVISIPMPIILIIHVFFHIYIYVHIYTNTHIYITYSNWPLAPTLNNTGSEVHRVIYTSVSNLVCTGSCQLRDNLLCNHFHIHPSSISP